MPWTLSHAASALRRLVGCLLPHLHLVVDRIPVVVRVVAHPQHRIDRVTLDVARTQDVKARHRANVAPAVPAGPRPAALRSMTVVRRGIGVGRVGPAGPSIVLGARRANARVMDRVVAPVRAEPRATTDVSRGIGVGRVDRAGPSTVLGARRANARVMDRVVAPVRAEPRAMTDASHDIEAT